MRTESRPRILLAAVVLLLETTALGLLGGCGTGGTETAGTAEFHPNQGLDYREPAEVKSENGVLRVTLDLARGPVDISGNQIVSNTYNESFPGPTLRVRPGDRIELDLMNNIDQPTNIHFHGLHVSPSGNSDNVFIHTHPGKTQHYSVQIPDDHPPGTFWYHSHIHGTSEEQVFGGMAGILIVDGLDELLPADLRGIEERVIALNDVRVRKGQLPTSDDQLNPRFFGPLLVNGVQNPRMTIRPGEVQHWRLANISATMWFRPTLDGTKFHVLAEDGNPVEDVEKRRALLLPPGKRYDVLVVGQPGRTKLRTLHFDQGFVKVPNKTLATIRSEGHPTAPVDMPTTVSTFDDLGDAEVARRRKVVFSQPVEDGNIEFLINGEAFDPHVINYRPRLGTVEEWVIKDITKEFHPFHIHVNDFQVMSINGEPYDANGLQDVVALPPHGEVVIRQRFADFTGKFVFHCHILDHEDLGMMQVVKVVE
jgi:FtsP/CotA-like multicopper oxidase with cupredoxin domain